MLIAASYSAERSLLLSFATRMALDLKIDKAFEKLTRLLAMKGRPETRNHYYEGLDEEERVLMREVRTWFGLMVLEHMYVCFPLLFELKC